MKKYTKVLSGSLIILLVVTLISSAIALASCSNKNKDNNKVYTTNNKNEESNDSNETRGTGNNEDTSIFDETNDIESNSSTEDISTDETSNDFTELDNLTSGSNSIESFETTTKDENNSTTKKETTENNKETTSKPTSTTKPSTVKPTTTKKENPTTKKEETTTAKPEVVWVEPSYGKAVTTKPAVNYEDYGWVYGQLVYTSSKGFDWETEYYWQDTYNVDTELKPEWEFFARDLCPEPNYYSKKLGEKVVHDIWVCLAGFDEHYDDPEHGTVVVLDPEVTFSIYKTGKFSRMGDWGLIKVGFTWYDKNEVWDDHWFTSYTTFQSMSISKEYKEFVMEKVNEVIEVNKPKRNGQYEGETVELYFYVWVEY